MYDVIVVGGGPGGLMAAKKCVEHGLEAVLLEQRKLPRDKVCSGLIIRPWAEQIIRAEFGEIPRAVLVPPHYLSGHMLHVPGLKPQKVEVRTGFLWRKDLDYWMSQQAKDKGVEIWEEAKVTSVAESDDGCRVQLIKAEERQELKAKFVIGANGANSMVRRSVFPGLHLRLVPSYRECYQGALALEKDYYHWIHPTGYLRPRFQANNKGDVFLLESTVKREHWEEMGRILLDYGFDPKQKPAWKDGCLVPAFYEELLSGSFTPARGNMLLVGDAAGLITSISDGIGAGLRSGALAVTSIIKASKAGRAAAEIYVQEFEPILAYFKYIHSLILRIEQRAAKGPQAGIDALTEVWEESQKAEWQ